MRRDIFWHCARLSSAEYATLAEEADSSTLSGLCLIPREGEPCRVEYKVNVDHAWASRLVVVAVMTPRTTENVHLERDASGHWILDGTRALHLDGCVDVDLGWTPATNTLPIRRTRLEPGASVTIAAAWIRFPELDVVVSRQRYTRLAADRWRYQSGAYDFELQTDPESGMVLAYGDDLWRATGPVTVSPPL